MFVRFLYLHKLKVHARELAVLGKEDVLINACCPGWVKTDMAGDKAPLSPDQVQEIEHSPYTYNNYISMQNSRPFLYFHAVQLL